MSSPGARRPSVKASRSLDRQPAHKHLSNGDVHRLGHLGNVGEQAAVGGDHSARVGGAAGVLEVARLVDIEGNGVRLASPAARWRAAEFTGGQERPASAFRVRGEGAEYVGGHRVGDDQGARAGQVSDGVEAFGGRQGEHRHGHPAGYQGAEEGEEELGSVWQRQHDVVAGGDALTLQAVGCVAGAVPQLRVGPGPAAGGNCGLLRHAPGGAGEQLDD
jgi:hypothetical protein